MGACLAYDPARARLHTLNPTAWLLLSLCDGRPRETIAEHFAREIASLPSAGPEGHGPEPGAFARGLERLVQLGLVTTHPPQKTDQESPP